MKHFSSLLVLLLLVAIAIPLTAQEGGDPLILSETGGDVSTLHPLISADGVASDVFSRFYPDLFTVNPATGDLEPGFKGALATGWEFNEDGTVLTMTLREDAFWSDGVQITAHDFIWAADALKSGVLDSPRSTSMFAELDDGTPGSGTVDTVVALDDFTLEFTFTRPDCNNILSIYDYVVPSHIYDEDFGDDLAALNEDPLYYPGVTWGAWTDPEILAGDRVIMQADQGYPDTELGYVAPSEWVRIQLEDGDIELERFKAGEIDLLGIGGADQAEMLRDYPDMQYYSFVSTGYQWVGYNLANPANPQPGFDEDGNYIEQEPHPVLGKKEVRQALTMAVNVDAIIENNLGGNAVRIGTGAIPTAWNYNPDLLHPFDPVASDELLTAAGWVYEDGSEFRVCSGCGTAEDGTVAELKLSAFDGYGEDTVNTLEFIAQSMREVGVNAEVEYLDWSSAFIPKFYSQEFDMVFLAWRLGVPLDPDNTDIWTRAVDVPGEGLNVGSYHNEELDQLFLDARDPALTEGCTTEGRKPYYDRVAEIVHDEQPYLFLYASLNLTAAQPWVENFDPQPFSRTWNEDAFLIDRGN